MGLLEMLFGGGKSKEAIAQAIHDGAFLVDVRSPGEFSGGSVKKAVNIPLDKIPQNIHKFKGKSGVIVFCRSGMRSSQAKQILEQNGIKNVVNGGTWNQVNALINPN